MVRPHSSPPAPTAPHASHVRCAQYALLRQQTAVQRVLRASNAEDSAAAARWARAWQRLVQQQLATADALALASASPLACPPARPAYRAPPGRPLH